MSTVGRASKSSGEHESQAEDIALCASRFLGEVLPRDKVEELLDEAYGSISDEYGIAEAIEWAKGFVIPAEEVYAGNALMKENGNDFDRVVEIMKGRLAHARMSAETVESLSADNPERGLALDRVEGVRVFTRDDFVRNGVRPAIPPRSMYVRAHTVVHKLFFDLVSQGLAVIMDSDRARRIEGIHYIVPHWAPKKGKECGRGITDASDDSYPDSILNGNEVRDKINEFYGIIEHPTIATIARVVLRALEKLQEARPNATLNDIDVYKCDLKGAFNLLWWRSKDAKLFSVELEGNVTMVFLCGTFGYTGMPGAFQVITRALKFELSKRCAGEQDMYVDDVMGAAVREAVDDDIAIVGEVSRGLLGPTAIADDKTERTNAAQRRMDALGYTINLGDGLESARVTISRRNRLKAAYGFFAVSFDTAVPYSTMEKLSSWSARYAFLCPFMKPFTSALFGTMKNRKRTASLILGLPARRAIQFWRSILCAIALNEDSFARPLRSFAPRRPEFVIRFDASLSGVGVLVGIAEKESDQEPLWVGGVAVSLLELEFGEDSSFQNCAEFIGATLSLFVLRGMGLSGRAVRLEGDSISALSWAEKGAARGERAHNASMVFSLAAVRWGLLNPYAAFGFISGENNFLCDDLWSCSS